MVFTSQIKVARFAGRTGDWTLIEDLVYRGNTDTFTIPRGFKTDFASIPRIFQALIPKNGSHDAAAIVHDFLYRTQPPTVTRKQADQIFYRIMREIGTNRIRARVIYLAVRVGGFIAWRRTKRQLVL